MNKVIKNIVTGNGTEQSKLEELSSLERDINIAKNILTGKYNYCKECDDYYLAKSFITEHETKETKICIYEDPINSGGNDYVDGYVDITYLVCPKGHKHEIDRHERRK